MLICFMLIRIRWQQSDEWQPYQAALGAGAVLAPLALLAFTLGCWAFGAEAEWTGPFPVRTGPWAHWQVWLSAALVLAVFCRILGRVGRWLLAETDRFYNS